MRVSAVFDRPVQDVFCWPILRRSSAIGSPLPPFGRSRARGEYARGDPRPKGDVKSGRWIVELHRALPTAPINDLRCTEKPFRSVSAGRCVRASYRRTPTQ